MGIKKDQLGKAVGVSPVILTEHGALDPIDNKVQVYAKDVGGIAELCILDDVGNEVQITSGGAVNGGGGSSGLLSNWWNASSDADGGFTGSDVVHDVSFAAEWNRINKWSGSFAGIVATLPEATTADHNRLLAFYEAADSGSNPMDIVTQGGQVFRYPGSGGVGPDTATISGGHGYVLLQYDASTTHWTVLIGADLLVIVPV